MVVDQSHGLHERVDGRRPDEAEAVGFQRLGEGFGLKGGRGDVVGCARRGLWWRLEAPDEACERPRLGDQVEGRSGVADRRLDLRAVTDDARIREQSRDLGFGKARDRLDVEPREGGSEGGTLSQDCQPGQASLKTLEGELLEEALVIVNRSTPLFVVVCDVERIGP